MKHIKINHSAFFACICLSLVWMAAAGAAPTAEVQAAPPSWEEGSEIPQCEFRVEEGQAALAHALPVLGDPEVVYTADGAVSLAGWDPGGERLLVVRDLEENRQAIEWWDPAARSLEPVTERSLSNSRPIWQPGSAPGTGQVATVDWEYAGAQAGEVVYQLRLGREIVADNLAGASVALLPSGELGYSARNGEWVVQDATGAVRAASITPPAPQSADYLQDGEPWQAPPYQAAPRPDQPDIVFYTQPDIFWVTPEGACALDLNPANSLTGQAPTWALDAQWSPDGRYLAMITTDTHPAQPRGLGAQIASTSLTILDFETFTRRTVSFAPELASGAGYVTDLAWSPDSRTLAALAILGQELDGTEPEGLFLVEASTGAHTYAGGAERLGGGAWGMQLAWSPDGQTLAAACPTDTEGRVCLLEVVGESAAVRTPPAFTVPDPPDRQSPRAGDYTMPDEITLDVYRLTASGARRSPYTLCEPATENPLDGDTAWGCTVFCSESGYGCVSPSSAVFPYPYMDSTATLLFEEEYLFNVVPQELPPYYDRVAVDAQTVAARSYAAYHIVNPPGYPYNNSTGFQAFIPRRFEGLYPAKYPDDSDHLWDDPCGADYSLLNSSQKKVCDSFFTSGLFGVFMTYQSTTPIRSEFSSDAYAVTKSGSPPYHVSVPDPISTACDANDFGHQRGMSQEGASRWARGHECAYSGASVRPGNDPGEPWQIKLTAEQILFHYYTGVHLRSQEGDVLTPDSRWLVLQYGWRYPFSTMLDAGRYPLEMLVQNAGTNTWEDGPGKDGAAALLVTWINNAETAAQQVYPLGIVMAPGAARWITFMIQPPGIPPGDYSLTFEMARFTGGNWRSFSELDSGFPPYTPYKLTLNTSLDHAPYKVYFPIVGR